MKEELRQALLVARAFAETFVKGIDLELEGAPPQMRRKAHTQFIRALRKLDEVEHPR